MNAICLLPSLNRPHLVHRFFGHYRKTKAEIPVLVIIDHKDPKKEEYLKLEYPNGCRLVLTESRYMGDKTRETQDQWINADAVMILNDDMIPMTDHWDEKVLNAINGTNVVFTGDGKSPDKPWNAPNRICGAITFSGKILRALGWMFPEGLQHLYSDEIWGFMFSRAKNAQCLMDVCIFHDHCYLDPKQRDETYKVVNGDADFQSQQPKGGLWESDRAAFERWLNQYAMQDTQKIIDLQPKQGVMIATPSHDNNVCMDYALGLTDAGIAMTVNNVYYEMARVCGSSLIPHARNSLVDMFMKSRCQRLLMIDADQGWNKEALFHLLQSPRMIIGGITPHKRFPINFNFKPLKEDEHFFKDLVNKGMDEFIAYAKAKADKLGNIEVEHIGTGFLMIDREVFNIMKDDVFEYTAFDSMPVQKHREYFKMSGESGHYQGEDWFFCNLARKHKIPLYINANVIVSHQGSFTWRG